jgi:AcrR family transcriptional regulator
MTVAPVRGAGLRDITRGAVRARLSEIAVDLFAEHGFDDVTVEQIADAAGISARSFHRYFRSKEDAVIGDLEPLGAFVADAFAARPRDEPVWQSLLASFSLLLERLGMDDDRGKRVMRVIASTASLRARNFEKHLTWAEILTPLIADRLGDDAELRASALAQTSLVCLDIALNTWARDGEHASSSALLERAFAAVAPAA